MPLLIKTVFIFCLFILGLSMRVVSVNCENVEKESKPKTNKVSECRNTGEEQLIFSCCKILETYSLG